MTINKEKIHIKNLDDLEKLKNSKYPGVISKSYQDLIINSDILFHIDHADLNGIMLRVNGNLYANSIRAWSIQANNVDATKLIVSKIEAKKIDCHVIDAWRIRTYNLIGATVTVSDSIIATNIKVSHDFRADNVKLGHEYKNPIYSIGGR